jgi:glycerol-3-phosphate acyltransferase PlsY
MTTNWALALVAVVASYFIGDLAFAYVVGKFLYGVDVRQYGSRNLGGTNVFRTLGPVAALLVIAGDVAKGAVAVGVGALLSGHNILVELLCGIAVIAGHNWPMFLRFQGGRGIGTSLGVLLGLMPKAAILPAVTFVLTVALTRYVSLGSILAALVFPFTVLWLGYPRLYLAGSLVVAAFALYRHIPNMRRLLAGKEFKLGRKVEVAPPPADEQPEGQGGEQR